MTGERGAGARGFVTRQPKVGDHLLTHEQYAALTGRLAEAERLLHALTVDDVSGLGRAARAAEWSRRKTEARRFLDAPEAQK